MNKLRYPLFVLTAFLVLALSALSAVPVYADDGAPPPDAAAEVSPPADDGGAVAEAPAAEAPPAGETAPVAEEPVTEAAPVDEVLAVEESAAEPETLPEILEQLPEGTELVVTDAAGEVLPLVTEEAAQVIAGNDPWWCPGAGKPSASGCTTGGGSGSRPTFAALISWMQTNAATGGTIWIEGAYDSSFAGDSDVTFDGDYFATGAVNGSLTLNGGWNGTANGLGTIDPSNYSVFNGDSLTIFNWGGAVTLNNIWLENAATNSNTDDLGYGGDAAQLYVDTYSNITLNNVYSVNSNNATDDMAGALLSNAGTTTVNYSSFEGNEGDGLWIDHYGPTVTINNTDFINNGAAGLYIDTGGSVVTNNIIAADNGGDGAYIDNSHASTAKTVTMKGFKHFIHNGGYGLIILTNGAINISNLVATDNGDVGVLIDNTYGASLTSPVYNGVILGGSNLFNDNSGSGLEVYSFGAISVSNITAMYNSGAGAFLDNCNWDDPVTNAVPGDCFAKSAKPITVSGTNILNHNVFGLDVESAGGAITLSNITASYNDEGGLYADNWLSNSADVSGTGAVILNGYGIFNENGNGTDGLGLEAYSTGSMTLKNVTANYNDKEGVYVAAAKNVLFSGVNTFIGNGIAGPADGAFVYSDNGTISMSNVTASGNAGKGMDLEGWKTITLTGVNTFNYNEGIGLYTATVGAILVNNITANGNDAGAELWNLFSPLLPANVTLNGVNTFNENNGNGLLVGSYGTILINNLTADGNGWFNTSGSGAVLDNCQEDLLGVCDTVTAKAVTLKGPVNVNGNYDRGLDISSLGVVSLGNVTANLNSNDTGVWINNKYDPAKQNSVTLTGVNIFSDNGGLGLEVYSFGAIAVSNVTANDNGWSGAQLDNMDGNLAKAITVSGVNAFNWNYADGLYFYSDGNVILGKITAYSNDWNEGIDVDGYLGSGINGETNGTIMLTCGFAYGNANYGIRLHAGVGKLVTINGVYAWHNGTNYDISAPSTGSGNCLLP